MWASFSTNELQNNLIKVDVPKSNTILTWTPIFEWCVVRCETKNWYQKHMCWKEIWIACSKYANQFGLIDHLMSTKILSLKMNKIFIWTPKAMRQMAYVHDLDLLITSYYLHVSYPMGNGCNAMQCPGRFLGITSCNPSVVSKSNQLHCCDLSVFALLVRCICCRISLRLMKNNLMT